MTTLDKTAECLECLLADLHEGPGENHGEWEKAEYDHKLQLEEDGVQVVW